MIGANEIRGLVFNTGKTSCSLSCLKPTGLMHEHCVSGCSGVSFLTCFVISEVGGPSTIQCILHGIGSLLVSIQMS